MSYKALKGPIRPRPLKGLIGPFKGFIRPLKGIIRPLKALIMDPQI